MPKPHRRRSLGRRDGPFRSRWPGRQGECRWRGQGRVRGRRRAQRSCRLLRSAAAKGTGSTAAAPPEAALRQSKAPRRTSRRRSRYSACPITPSRSRVSRLPRRSSSPRDPGGTATARWLAARTTALVGWSAAGASPHPAGAVSPAGGALQYPQPTVVASATQATTTMCFNEDPSAREPAGDRTG